MIQTLWLIVLGLANGFAVGTGFVAFITVLDIIPRMVQLTRVRQAIPWFEYAIVLGVVTFTWFDFYDMKLYGSPLLILPVGLAMGMFVGMLAAALTEVLNVFPILIRRIGLKEALPLFLMAMALGKVVGSLVQWIWLKF